MEAAMGLMRRVPPKHTETALSALLSLLPQHSSDLLSQVDQPLQVLCDVDSGRSSYCASITEMRTLIDGAKTAHGKRGCLQEGSWDAIHVIEVGPVEDETARYCLTSSVMLSLTTNNDSAGTFNLSGSIRRQFDHAPFVTLGSFLCKHMKNVGNE
ncbi:putative F-actin-capping protein subunit beta [Sesamum angolense]|uniref:F-actin-capping protein subunit beta n=1 Tax=Sesamum angolense TaxID=2727404 RepID=A0AAE1WB56_9LAMI|nr:putative F-actin-capping protein subunit beta [Sesamum angolense]